MFFLDVRKSGQSGTGKGSLALIVLDNNMNSIFDISHGLTVGAKAPQGVNSKNWKQKMTITSEKAKEMIEKGVFIIFNANTEYDNNGIFTSLNTFKQFLLESIETYQIIQELGFNESLMIDNIWNIKRLK